MYYTDCVPLGEVRPTIKDISDADRKIVSVLNCNDNLNYLVISTDRPDIE